MKTFDEWLNEQPNDVDIYPFSAWEASWKNAQEEISNRDERIVKLAAQNQQLRDLLNHFRDDVLFRIGINSPYRTDVTAPYYERVKAVLSLPDLASQHLNRVKAEALRSAADRLESYEYIKNQPPINYAEAFELRRMADAIEKGEKV